MTLFAPRSGGLWVGYRFGGASFIKDGRITSYREREGLPISSVTRFAQDAAGVVWATTSGGLRRFDGSLWEDVREALNLPSEYVKSPLYVARDGSLWVVSGHAVMVLRPRESVFAATSIQTSEGEVDFVEAPDGTLWLTDENLGARALYVPAAQATRGRTGLHFATCGARRCGASSSIGTACYGWHRRQAFIDWLTQHTCSILSSIQARHAMASRRPTA